MPYLDYTDLEDTDLDILSKFIQRIGAVGMIPGDPELVNEILERGDFDYRVDEDIEPGTEEYNNLFPKFTSRSGDGMDSGMSDGVGDSSEGDDDSTTNLENN